MSNGLKTPYYRVVVKTNQRELTQHITSFSFTDSVEENDVLTLQMKGVSLGLINETELSNGVLLLFSFGYLKGKSSGQHTARITNIDYNYGATIDITIKALDLGIILKKGKETVVHQNTSVNDFVKSVAKRFGMDATVNGSIRGESKLNEPIEMLPQSNETVWETMKKALAVAGTGDFILFSKNNSIIVKPRGVNNPSKRTFTYNDGNSVISFKPSEKDTSKSEFSEKTVVTGIDEETNEPFTTSGDNSGTANTGLKAIHYEVAGGEQYLTNTTSGTGQKSSVEGTLIKPTENQTEANVLANSEKQEASLNDIKAVLTIEGDPNISADDVITMNNVAEKHGGNWYVKKSKNSLKKSGGFITVLELGKNATNKKEGDNKDLQNVNNTTGGKEVDEKKTVTESTYLVDGSKEYKGKS